MERSRARMDISPTSSRADLPGKRDHASVQVQGLLPTGLSAGNRWRHVCLEVSGLVQDRSKWTLARLRTLPQESQITRHICIEGWSQIGQWAGVPLRVFLQRVGADTTARYVGFKCA